ncbi:MAG TPA: hypothetical protein VMF14_09505 [Solirubrobacteraceae bacterium]|nr:hypothetical protein [Solirubrobacteraceae bacterium]
MQSIERPRQYVSPARLYAMYPVLRFSYERGAYVLRFVGETRGPVLRKNRRRRQRAFSGGDRRAGGIDPILASRPVGNVRRIEPGSVATAAAESPAPPARVPNTKRSRAEQSQATRRRRPEGRQQPPRPHR